MNLQGLLEPRTIAIVGASPEPKKIPGMIVDFLRKSGYGGRIFPVNPRYPKIHEFDCYPDVDALPETPELVVVVIPVAAAMPAVEAAARRGVPFCLLMSGGFGEGRTGEAGRERHAKLLALCRDTGMHVVGPNTVGMVNFRHRMPLTFADWYGRDTGLRGGVAIVTHSGSVGGLIFSSLQLAGIGVDYWIGLGNEATLETADFIDHFSSVAGVHTIICYMEGVQDGRSFMAAAEKARQAGKRVVVVKAGDCPESLRSTLSHTGKNPTAVEVYAAAFRQCGVIHAASLAELAYVMTLLATVGGKTGDKLSSRRKCRVGILSASGGANSLIADHVMAAGLQLPELPKALQQQLNAIIPEYGSSENPVDLSADVIARGEILDGTLALIREEPGVDAWLVFGRPIIDRYAAALIEFATGSSRALIVCCGVPLAPELHARLQQNGIAVLADPELCLRALARVQRAAYFRDIAPGAALKIDAEPLEVSRGGTPVLSLAIEQDRDFGAVLALSAVPSFGSRSHRIVRVLPATALDLEDAVLELAALHGGLPAEAEDIVAALYSFTRLHAGHRDAKGGASIDLTVEAGVLRVCTPDQGALH
jgi:acyl-CoA synthetase (NDP forming)